MIDLAPEFHLIAVNLIGYGETTPYTHERPQSLQDQSDLIEEVAASIDGPLKLIGHSLGGSVAIKAASNLGDRIEKLILIEPNPFNLLRDYDRPAAFAEIFELCISIKQHVSAGNWSQAAEEFADYWGGEGTWEASPDHRRDVFLEGLKTNFHEWDAVINERFSLATLDKKLPKRTLVIYDPQTKRPIREVVDLLRGATSWTFHEINDVGHMAPLTHPAIINPVIEQFLSKA